MIAIRLALTVAVINDEEVMLVYDTTLPLIPQDTTESPGCILVHGRYCLVMGMVVSPDNPLVTVDVALHDYEQLDSLPADLQATLKTEGWCTIAEAETRHRGIA